MIIKTARLNANCLRKNVSEEKKINPRINEVIARRTDNLFFLYPPANAVINIWINAGRKKIHGLTSSGNPIQFPG